MRPYIDNIIKDNRKKGKSGLEIFYIIRMKGIPIMWLSYMQDFHRVIREMKEQGDSNGY